MATNPSITDLWNFETNGISDPAAVKSAVEEDAEAISYYKSTVRREKMNGRYNVALPWKQPKSTLPTNRQVAEKRLRSATAKLKKTGKWENYDCIFKYWEKENFIKTVDDCDNGRFLPHRPVFKESLTTPVRPVFDASCRNGRLPSLKDCLYKGPNLIELIPTLLLRFRLHKVGIYADIRKAFQMIGGERAGPKLSEVSLVGRLNQ
ncbi:uncharacterized protein LOC124165772 [Ischnura elegans]|uniref:uncharacterized protein LOC124165772 n=1 Tax=Ischnura elegans TaxID=197161 RepID=UPI001ED89FA8|nr:uncharacterized protein LOC124165772 [Ischnura elegans]